MEGLCTQNDREDQLQGQRQHGARDTAAADSDNDDDSGRLSPVSPPAAGEPAALDQRPSSPVPVPRGSRASSNGCADDAAAPQQQPLHRDGPLGPQAVGSAPARHTTAPEDPDLLPEVLEQLLQHASPALSDARFSMAEFLKNSQTAMTAAARRELVGGGHHATAQHGGAGEDDDVAASLEDAGHFADLARQAAHLSSLTEGVAEESKVNRELAGLLVERLEASKKAVECLMRLLTCLMEAEAAYSTAMSAAAKTASAGPLAAPSDSSSLVSALDGMVALPAAAAAGHRQLYLELQLLTDGARGLWRRYTATVKDLKQSVHTVQRGIDGCCKQLLASLAEHQSACEAFDAAVVWQGSPSSAGAAAAAAAAAQGQQQPGTSWHRRTASSEGARGSGRGGGWGGAAGVAAASLRPRFSAAPPRDPWSTEGRLVAEQQALKRRQDQERHLLQQAFETLQVLEAERISDLLRAGQALAASYPAAVQSLPPAAEQLRERLGGLGGAGEAGLAQLAKTAAEMRATSEALALRQAEALEVVGQELFCSPEIIRQGPMELWYPRTSSWGCCHFVLTRAGYLHWFKSMQDTAPLEPALNLSRCEFEAGQAPAFHLVELGTGSWLVGRGSRKVTLKASSVDECCEWAIALREAIALSTSSGSVSRTGSGAGRH